MAGVYIADAGVTAEDNIDGDLGASAFTVSYEPAASVTVADDGTVAFQVPTTYTATYSVVDSQGNVATAERTIHVQRTCFFCECSTAHRCH